MKAYSLDLRQRIVEAVLAGASHHEAAQRFGVGATTVQRYVAQFRRSGNLAPKPIAGRSPIIKDDEHEEFKALVASRSDWMLESLGDAWAQIKGVKPTISVLSNTCQRLKITRKKSPASPANETRTSGPPTKQP